MTVASPRSSRGLTVTPGGPAIRPVRPIGRMPTQGLCRTQAGIGVRVESSGTEPLSCRIDEARAADLDRDVAAAHRIESAHAFADPLRPAAEKAEADPMPERRRE